MTNRIRIGYAGKPLARFAKGRAGDERYIFLVDQTGTEFLAGQAERTDFRKYVKRPLGREARNAASGQAVQYQPAAAVIFVFHLFNVRIAMRQRINSGKLAGCRRAHNAVLVDFEHLRSQFGRREQIAEPPARHRMGFGKASDDNGALAHPVQQGDGGMDVLLSHFVADNRNIRTAQHVRDRLQIGFFHHSSGRVIRKRENQRFGARRNGTPQLIGG